MLPAVTTLPELLWSVLNDVARACQAEGAVGPRMPSLDLWANLLRVLGHEAVDLRQLPAALRLSKRAVKTRVATAVRHGWVEREVSDPGRAKVRLTTQGHEVARRWKSIEQAGEKRWVERIGVDRAGFLRTALENIVAAFPLEHPYYPAAYGNADASVTGGNGQDWKPVFREAGKSASRVPTSALVAQALVAFALDYEKVSPVALTLSRTILMRIPPSGRLLNEIGNRAGISALTRHGFLRLSGGNAGEMAFLTTKGLSVSAQYDDQIRAVEIDWSERFGNDPVNRLRRALEEANEPTAS